VLSNLKLILIGVLAAALFAAGYALGARKVAALETQIESIKNSGKEAVAKQKLAQEEIAKTLKDKEAAFAKQAQQLKAEADQKAKALAAALAGADTRIKSLQAQVAGNQAQRARLEEQLRTASAAEKTEIQGRIDALDKDKKALVAKVDANECLALAVPEAVIGSLMVRK
jgi:chromosome segregation ATPase